MPRLSLILAPLLALAGCGGMWPTVDRTTYYPDGRIVRERLSLPAGHFLADPAIAKASFGDLTFEGMTSKTDNEGLSAFVAGVGQTIGHLFGKP